MAVFATWLFYKTGWYSLILFIPLAATPLLAPGYAGLLGVFIVPAAFGTAGGLCFRSGKGFGFFMTVSTILFSVLFTTEYHALRYLRNTDIIEKARDEFVQTIEQKSGDVDKFLEAYKTPEMTPEQFKAQKTQAIAEIKDSKWLQFARDMVPFSSFIYGVLICGLSFMILKKWVMKNPVPQVKTLEFMKVNDYIIFALIAGWGGFILLDSSRFPALSIAALNLALMVSTLYVAQAMGIIKYFMVGRGLPAVILPLILFTTVALWPPIVIFLTIILLGLGALDLWADFRKLNPDNERNNKE